MSTPINPVKTDSKRSQMKLVLTRDVNWYAIDEGAA